MILELDDTNFGKTIENGIVLVDFWAAWCGPCKVFTPVLEEVANEDTTITVTKVNVDDNSDLAGKYNVMSIPTLLFFKDGQLKDTSVGVVSKQIILNKISALR